MIREGRPGARSAIQFIAVLLLGGALAVTGGVGAGCGGDAPQAEGTRENAQSVVSGLTLRVSTSPTRSASVPLNGATLSGSAYVFTSDSSGSANPAGIVQVRYWLDNTAMSTPPKHVENYAPYDFTGTASGGTADPWDTSTLTSGTHTITQSVTPSSGAIQTVSASFSVQTTQSKITLGTSVIEPIVDNGDANILIATSATLSEPGTVGSMSLYIPSGGAVGDATLAIYDATGSGGAPGALLAHTASFALVSGWNTQPVTTSVSLRPGAYYVAFMPSSNSAGPVYTRSASNSNYYVQTGSYGALPTSFGTGISQPGLAYSEYATLTASACTPTTCAAEGKNCGTISDGCGGQLSCGTCTAPATCGGGGVANVCGGSGGHSYTTNFPLTENPISEGGRWMNGGTVALDWGNFLTTGGHAISAFDTSGYGDPTAILTGTWAPNQTAEGTVYAGSASGGAWPEVEMRLRFSLSAHRAAGYEITFSVLGGTHGAYAIIVRWNGALNDFTYLSQLSGSQYAVTTGDVIKATIVGNVITAYKNGVQMGQVTDSTYATGNPGMGVNGGSGNGSYGFSSFTASD
jgi:hypothetical protein